MKEITGHTKLTGLLGSPVAHSISPMMHNEAFRQLNLDYVYLAFDVHKDNLKTAVDGLKSMGARGFNLTMPHKVAMMEYCDELSPAARLCGAVNTVVNENGKLIGHTTDGIGYMRAAYDAGYDLKGKTMTLLGAGGASTSIFVQAALDGMKEIRIFNRKGTNFDKCESIIEKVNASCSCKVTLHDLNANDDLHESILSSDILTNATNVGMAPDLEGNLISDTSVFHPNLIVSDIIYNPRETAMMQLAKQQGCETFNGLYMLLYQGAEAFRLWTGQEMPIDMIKEKYFK